MQLLFFNGKLFALSLFQGGCLVGCSLCRWRLHFWLSDRNLNRNWFPPLHNCEAVRRRDTTMGPLTAERMVSPRQQLGWRRPCGSGLLYMRSRSNNREPSSPWRTVTRSVVHLRVSSGLELCAKSGLWIRGNFPVPQNEGTMGALIRNQSSVAGLSWRKTSRWSQILIPNEAQRNRRINHKLMNVSRSTDLISRMWPHQRNLVVASPEQSPDGVQLPLEEQWKGKSNDLRFSLSWQ